MNSLIDYEAAPVAKKFQDSCNQVIFINKKYVKDSPDPSHFIFEINVGKRRIRQTTTLTLNDGFLDRFKID